jgi:hypothetical protein
MQATAPSAGLGLNDVGALINTVSNEAGAGLGDKFAAAMDAWVGNPQTWFGGETIPGATWQERYRNQIQHYRQQRAQETAAHPVLSTAANVGGAVLNPLNRLGPLGWMASGALHGAGDTDPNAGWGETAGNMAVGALTDVAAGKVAENVISPLANALLATPAQKAILRSTGAAYPVVKPVVTGVSKLAATLGLGGVLHGIGIPDWMIEAGGIGSLPHVAKSVISDLGKAYANATARAGARQAAVTAARAPFEIAPGVLASRYPRMQLAFPGQTVGPWVGAITGQGTADEMTPSGVMRSWAARSQSQP